MQQVEIGILLIILLRYWYNCVCPLWWPQQIFNWFSLNCVSNEIAPQQQHDSWLAWHTISYQIPLHCFLLTFWATCISDKLKGKLFPFEQTFPWIICNNIYFSWKKTRPNMSHKYLSYSFLIIHISSIFQHS